MLQGLKEHSCVHCKIDDPLIFLEQRESWMPVFLDFVSQPQAQEHVFEGSRQKAWDVLTNSKHLQEVDGQLKACVYCHDTPTHEVI